MGNIDEKNDWSFNIPTIQQSVDRHNKMMIHISKEMIDLHKKLWQEITELSKRIKNDKN